MRRAQRGPRGWSLLQVAAASGVGRGTARSAVARGMLPQDGYTEVDVVLLRVAAACLAFPDPAEPPPPKSRPEAARPGRRDATALRFARACLADPATTAATCLLLRPSDVDVAEDAAALARLVAAAGPETVLVLPLGRWAAGLAGAQRAPRAAVPAAAPLPLALVDDPFGA